LGDQGTLFPSAGDKGGAEAFHCCLLSDSSIPAGSYKNQEFEGLKTRWFSTNNKKKKKKKKRLGEVAQPPSDGERLPL
jgi:hypothetical protein